MLDLMAALNVTEWPCWAGALAPRTLPSAHDDGCDQSLWRDLLPLLAEHRCITFNHPGAGLSDPAAHDPGRHAQTLLDLVRQLARLGLVLVGHSISAMIGVLAAVAQPQAFAQWVPLCPSPSLLNDVPDCAGAVELAQLESLLQDLADGHAALARALAPAIMANRGHPAPADRLAEGFCALDPTVAQRRARASFLTNLRPQVQMPALVVRCRNDTLAPPAVGQWTAAQLPRGRFAWLDASGHCPHMSHPAEVARGLLADLAEPQDRLPTEIAA